MRIRTATLIGLAALSSAGAAEACEPGAPHYRPHHFSLPRDAGWLTPDGAIRVVGYNDMAGALTAIDTLFTRAHPGIRFELVLKGTRTAPPALLDGTSAFAPMGADVSISDVAAMKSKTGWEPLRLRVAHDSLDPKALSGPLGVFVHPDNPLASLTLQQIARLFAADGPRTWGDLGLTGVWAKREIHLEGLKPETAMGEELRERVFPESAYSPAMIGFAQSREVVAAVAADPLAVGFAGMNRSVGQVKMLALAPRPGARAVGPTRDTIHAGRYPLDRYLLIYASRDAKGRLEPLVREYLNLVFSCEGQAAIGADPLGYIPLNPTEIRAERAKLR